MNVTKGSFRPWIFGIILLLHLFAGWGLWEIFARPVLWVTWVSFALLYTLSSLGISMGYHRYFTHTAFKASPWLEKVMAGFSALALEGTLTDWTTNHHQHHAYADKPWDPHTPKDGFWWSHVLWIFFVVKRPPGYNPKVGFEETVKWQRRWYWWIVLCGFLLPFAASFLYSLKRHQSGSDAWADGWQAILVSGFLRSVIHLHATWSVNSIAHLYGKKPVDAQGRPLSGDTSRNSRVIAIFTFVGEWLHGNHHADPRCAQFGWGKYDLDMVKWLLILFERCGWARDVRKHQPLAS